MLFKFLIFSALLAAPALGSAIKGYQQQPLEAPTKGNRPLLSPIEQIKLQQKPERLEQQQQQQQQQEEPLHQEKYTAQEQQQKLEELPRQTEEQQQKLEEAPREEPLKGHRYEARPQLSRDELAKGQPISSKYSEQREEPLPAAKGQRQEELPKAAAKTEEPLAKGQTTRYEQAREEPVYQAPAKGTKSYEQRREELPKTEQQRQEEPLAKGQSIKYTEQQREEPLAKGQLKVEHRGEDWSSKGAAKSEQPKYTEQREEPLPAAKGAPKFEQREQQQQEELKQEQYEQQVELQQEQRRYEPEAAASPLLVQPIQPLTIVEETRSEQFQQQQQIEQHAVKGGELSAPAGLAEPYAFSYQVDGSSRSESGDSNGVVRGQYTLQGADGLSRVVEYVADHNGFRAAVNTNEPGTQAGSPANINLRTSQANAEDITLRLEGKTREDLAAPQPQLQLQATKGAAPALAQQPAKASEWAIKAPAPALPLPAPPQPQQLEEALPAPSKSLPAPLPVKRAEEPLKTLKQEQREEPARESAKSAELTRTPKALGGELKANQAPTQLRAGFESATAHRTYVRPAAVVVSHRQPTYQQAPAVPVRLHHQHQQQQAPPSSHHQAARVQAPAVSRAYLQRERYPPSPVNQPGYRRSPQPAGNTRVSFYSAPPAIAAPAPIPIGYDDFESTVDSS